MVVIVTLGWPYARSIYSIVTLCMELNALKISTHKSVTLKFFVRTHSMIRQTVRVCKVADGFLRKLFWLFSISGSMRSRSRSFYTLTALQVRVMPLKFLAIPRSLFIRKGRIQPFVHSSIVFGFYRALQNRSSNLSNFLFFYTSGVFPGGRQVFCFKILLVLRWVLLE